MRTFGIIGYPLSHSFSQKYFTEKFKKENIADCEYKVFPIEKITEFPAVITNNSTLCGLSVTIPHKQNIIQYLNDMDPAAKEIGAVNCVRVSQGSSTAKLTGYNTDVYGFEQSLKPLLKPQHSKALILGTGGAAKAVAYILDKLNIKFRSVSRTQMDLMYSDLNKSILEEHTLIINASPVGMYPNVNSSPDIPYEFLTKNHLLYDLIYNPEESLFLKRGKEKRAQVKNGLEMLHLQAEKAWEIWNGPT